MYLKKVFFRYLLTTSGTVRFGPALLDMCDAYTGRTSANCTLLFGISDIVFSSTRLRFLSSTRRLGHITLVFRQLRCMAASIRHRNEFKLHAHCGLQSSEWPVSAVSTTMIVQELAKSVRSIFHCWTASLKQHILSSHVTLLGSSTGG